MHWQVIDEYTTVVEILWTVHPGRREREGGRGERWGERERKREGGERRERERGREREEGRRKKGEGGREGAGGESENDDSVFIETADLRWWAEKDNGVEISLHHHLTFEPESRWRDGVVFHAGTRGAAHRLLEACHLTRRQNLKHTIGMHTYLHMWQCVGGREHVIIIYKPLNKWMERERGKQWMNKSVIMMWVHLREGVCTDKDR